MLDPRDLAPVATIESREPHIAFRRRVHLGELEPVDAHEDVHVDVDRAPSTLRAPRQRQRATERVIEAGLSSVIERLTGDGQVAHEEDIGYFAALRGSADCAPIHDYKMVDDDFLLAPVLALSHLACADEPDHPMNRVQADAFEALAARLPGVRRSLAATGGIMLGARFHHGMTRPGIGLFGGLPFAAAKPVVTLALPVIQVREVAPGEAVGYGAAWTAPGAVRIATVAAGYADGLLRALGNGKLALWSGDTPCDSATVM